MADVLEKILNEFPFSEIRSVETEGQQMVFFPKTYVKVEGNGDAGTTWKFSDVKKDGYLVSNGGNQWGGLTYLQCREKAQSLGEDWDMLNIWDYHFRGMLMLIETLAMGYTSADVQTAIGGTDGAAGITHFGIKDIWGGVDRDIWIYGLDTSNELGINNTNIHILGKYGAMVDTGLAPSDSGYPVTFHTKKAAAYDLGDILLGATFGKMSGYGSCGDGQDLNYSSTFYTAWGNSRANLGPFYLNSISPTTTLPALSFALRKAV